MDTTMRLIKAWTRTHTVGKVPDDPCAACNEPIRHGQYRREVWVSSHPRFGDTFIIVRYHDHPECPHSINDNQSR